MKIDMPKYTERSPKLEGFSFIHEEEGDSKRLEEHSKFGNVWL